ncbi:MAG: NUDIX domain-containing protein [Bacteroidales bacterium]
MSYTYKHPRPAVTVDMAVFARFGPSWKVLLIRRGNPPFEGQWALPGGFVEMDEKLIESAQRELEEETGIKNVNLLQFRTYGDPGRDPRGRTVAVVHYGFVNSDKIQVKGGDDASEAAWFAVDDLPGLAFDHSKIMSELLEYLKDHLN